MRPDILEVHVFVHTSEPHHPFYVGDVVHRLVPRGAIHPHELVGYVDVAAPVSAKTAVLRLTAMNRCRAVFNVSSDEWSMGAATPRGKHGRARRGR